MIEKIYQKKVFVKAFQFDGDADNFIFNADTPQWAINARKNEEIKKRNSETLYIDHMEHTDFVHKGDYIVNENGRIFSLTKERFDKLYEHKDGWIPCSERLPEKYGSYLVTALEHKETVVSLFVFDNIQNCFPTAKGIKVIAWQPLPEAYHEPLD